MTDKRSFIRFIANDDHYNDVLSRGGRCETVAMDRNCRYKRCMYKGRMSGIPFLGVLANLIVEGVVIRLMHARNLESYS